MSDQENKPNPDRLKRLLALALDSSSADGEAMNALRAARKIVVELGGFEAAITAMKDVCKSSPKQERPRYQSYQDFEFKFYGNHGNPFSGGFSGWDEDRRSRENREAQRQKEAADRKAKERAEQARKDAEQEAKDRREWELRKAMGEGLPVWEALRRRRLWKPGEAIDDGLDIFPDEMAEFAKTLNEKGR